MFKNNLLFCKLAMGNEIISELVAMATATAVAKGVAVNILYFNT